MTATVETYAKPLNLYRYRSFKTDPHGRADPEKMEQELDAVAGGYIYCSTYNKLNDPMEGFYRSSSRLKKHPEYTYFTEQVRYEKLGAGLASLSETWDNELMWAHYADSFNGICVAYSFTRLLHGMTEEHAFSRVAYVDRPHYLNLGALAGDAERARAVLSTKSQKWAYEREWRLFAPEPGGAFHGVVATKSVYMGNRMNAQDKQVVRKALAHTKIAVKEIEVEGYLIKRRRVD